jgi:tetratricopeptide (TPR) repeat protein
MYAGIFLQSVIAANSKRFLYVLLVVFFSVFVFYPVNPKHTPSAEKEIRYYSFKICSIRNKIKETENTKKKSLLYTEQAVIYLRLKGYEQALYLLHKAVRLDPENKKAQELYKFSYRLVFNSF